MRSVGSRFRKLLETALAARPFQTDQGVVSAETRELYAGYRGGEHEPTRCWIYRPHGTDVEMLFGFYSNFTSDDLITKVVALGSEIRRGLGATIQFNASESMTEEGSHFALHHHGRVTVRHSIRRASLVNCIQSQAPEADRMLGGLDAEQGWPLQLGTTDRLDSLIDRMFLYCFAVEQAKRSFRKEPRLPTLREEAVEPALESPRKTARPGPRWRVSAEARAVIEQAAMTRALEHYRRHWQTVEDVSARQPYDLHCRGGGLELRVEVKGTTLDGTAVQLTPNEVGHARTHRSRVALFVVHGLELRHEPRSGSLTAHGGTVLIYEPWNIDDCDLVPSGYSCLLPNQKSAPV